MRKSVLYSLAAVLAMFGGISAQSADYFSTLTNLHPAIYLPLTETVSPPASKPPASNLGSLGSADNGIYIDGAFPGVPGALAGDSDTAGLFSGAPGVVPRVVLPYDPGYAVSNFTIEFWFNSAIADPPASSPVNCAITGSTRFGWLLYLDSVGTGEIDFHTYTGTGDTAALDYVLPVPGGHILSNTWYHVAITFDGTVATGYINGQAQTASTNGSIVPSLGQPFGLGARSDGSFPFAGFLDEVAFYGSVLSASDIANHYAAGTGGPAGAYTSLVTADSPLLYYRLDDASAPIAVNYGSAGAFANGYYESGVSPGSSPPAPLPQGLGSVAVAFTSPESGDIGASIALPGTAGLALGTDVNNPITVAAWVLSYTPSYFTTILGKGDQAYRFDIDGGGYPHWNVGNAGEVVGGTPVGDGNWHFWVGTWDGTNIENFYIDGVQVGVATGNSSTNGNFDPFLVGTAPDDTGRNFQGYLREVAVFPAALTLAQVESLFFVAGEPPKIVTSPSPSVVLVGSNISLTVSAIGAPPLSYQWYSASTGQPVSVGNASGATTATLTFTGATKGDEDSYYVVVTDGNGQTVQSASASLLVITGPLAGSYFSAVVNLNPLGYWPLGEIEQPVGAAIATNIGTLGAAGNAAYSKSGINYQFTGATGDGDNGIFTDGAAGIVKLPYSSALALKPPFTAESWLAAYQPSSELCPLACVDANDPRSGWLIYMDGVNPGAYNFRLYNQDDLNTSLNISGPANSITAGLWYHLVVSYDGTNGYMYVNGQLVASGASTGFVPNDSGDLTIGGRSDGGFLFEGGEDEVAIYTNLLTPETILAHYQAGTNAAPATSYEALVLQSQPILYYRLDEQVSAPPPESSDPVANNYGASGSADNGYYLPGSFPGSVPGPSVKGFPTNVACHFANEFGGYVDIPDSSGPLNLVGPVTLTAWIQGGPENINNFQSFAGHGDNSYRGDIDQTGNVHFADGVDNNDAVGPDINDGAWHFVAGAWDGTNETLYVDGKLVAVQSATSPVAGDNFDFVVGGDGQYSPGGGRIFNGNVAQVAVFGTALGASAIQSLYYSAEVPPYITQQVPSTETIVEFASGTVSVAADGTPSLGYQWYHGSTALTNGGDFSGVTTPSLTIAANSLADAGAYTAVVTNAYGSVTSAVVNVSITQAPAIVSDLSTNPIILYAGNQVDYNIGAVGVEPLVYQWYNGSTLIGGAGSSNLIFGASGGTNLYSVVISNAFGVTTSSVATVIGQTFVSPPGGFAVNFSVGPGSVTPYQGLGAYEDVPTYTNWNLISAVSGEPTGNAVASSGDPTLVTFTLDFGFNNTGLPNPLDPNGTVGYLVGTEDAVNPGSPGIGTSANPMGQFIIDDLPPGHYSLYLYAANYDGDRGSVFDLNPANPGHPDNGINFAINGSILGLGNDTAPGQGLALNGGASQNTSGQPELAISDNYVFYHNVVPDVNGTVSGIYFPIPNPISGNTLEAPFNGLQIVLQQISITPSTSGSVNVSWSGGALYSGPSVNGPWTLVAPVGTAGYPVNTGYIASTGTTNFPAADAAQFFLVY